MLDVPGMITAHEAVGAMMDKNNYTIALEFVQKEIAELKKQNTKRAKNLVLALQLSENLLKEQIEYAQWTIDNCNQW